MTYDDAYQKLSETDKTLIDLDQQVFGTSVIIILNGSPIRVHPDNVLIMPKVTKY